VNWTIHANYDVHGLPMAQPRPRADSRGGRPRIYDPGTADKWKEHVAFVHRIAGVTTITGPVRLALTFSMPRPKSGPNRLTEWHTCKPDLDNLAKAVMDALTAACAWQDDSQVCEMTVMKKYGEPGVNVILFRFE